MDKTARNIQWTMQEFGLTHTEATEVETLRNGGQCDICGRAKGDMLLQRDHNHISKTFRGVLCLQCNLALGLIADKPNIARAMAEYLERPPMRLSSELINPEDLTT